MNRTDIEYLDYTWNPLAMLCTPISEGCAHCWHIRMAKRLAGNDRFPDDVRAAYAGERRPMLIEKRLKEPNRLRKPSRIGVQFMGDLFHPDIDMLDIGDIWDIMEQATTHTFMALTKRPSRMLEFLQAWGNAGNDHIWLGVTVENQAHEDRIRHLLQCPAAVRFVSIEPMLEEIVLENHYATPEDVREAFESARKTGRRVSAKSYLSCPPGIDWIIAGAETGPGARPADPAWFRSVRDQCAAAGVPFFMKRVSGGADTPADLAIREWPGGGQ